MLIFQSVNSYTKRQCLFDGKLNYIYLQTKPTQKRAAHQPPPTQSVSFLFREQLNPIIQLLPT